MSCSHRIQQFPRNFLCWQAPGWFSQIYEYNPQSQTRLTYFGPMTNLIDFSEETDITWKSFEILSKQKKFIQFWTKSFFYFQDDRPDNGRALKRDATTLSTNDTHHNDNQHNKLLNIIMVNVVVLSVALFHCYVSLCCVCRYAECRYAEWRYAVCRYAECRHAECGGTLKETGWNSDRCNDIHRNDIQ
jgi:hypothetical protein